MMREDQMRIIPMPDTPPPDDTPKPKKTRIGLFLPLPWDKDGQLIRRLDPDDVPPGYTPNNLVRPPEDLWAPRKEDTFSVADEGKKKASLTSRMIHMLRTAEDDGQTPKQWVVSPEFWGRLVEEITAGDLESLKVYATPSASDSLFLGLPVKVDPHTLHECSLDI